MDTDGCDACVGTLPLITPALLAQVGAKDDVAKIFAPLLEKHRVVPGDGFNTITSRNGLAMLVAQLSHESQAFSRLTENLDYSVQNLRKGNRERYFSYEDAVFYGRIQTPLQGVIQYANQRMIANLYYGGRLGNRGTHTDDGWDFRGAGLIQLTGRENHTKFGESVGMSPIDAARYCRTPEGAVVSAFWFWRTKGLVLPAFRGDVRECTRLINGGEHGLAERELLFRQALEAL